MTKYRERIVENARRTQAIAAFVSELVAKDELPGIVFVRQRDHAESLALEIGAHLSLDVPAVTAAMPQAKRDKLLNRMRSRDKSLPVVVATTVWSTGVDVPPLEWALVAGQGKAPIPLRQESGRLTRKHAEKAGYTLYDWMDTGGEMDGYRDQNLARLETYKRSGFNVATAALVPKTEPSSRDTATGRLEELLNCDGSIAGATGIPERKTEDAPLTSGQQLADAMCQTPEGFLLLLCFYALVGIVGFTTILALLRLLICGPA